LRMGRIMAPANRLSGWLVQSAFQLLRGWPRVRDYFAQMKYKPQPKFGRGFLIPTRRARGSTLVGRLLQQPLVTRAGGERVLLDEVLGPGFSLLCEASHLEQLETFVRQPVWSQLPVRGVALSASVQETLYDPQRSPQSQRAPTAAPHPGIEIVADEDGALLKTLTSCRGQVLLIRPDHYVAAVFALSDPLEASQRFEELVAATWPRADAVTSHAAR